MSQLTRDYKGAGHRSLRPGGMKEFALGALAGALLAGGIAALIAAQGRHRQARSSPACTAAGGTQSPGNEAAGAGPAAAATEPSHTAAGSGAGGTAAPAAGHTAASPAQHYDFYQMLPRQTVPVPAKSSTAQTRPPAAPARSAASPGYLLQVGSYSSDAQARQVLERLTRMGLSAQIQRVTESGRALERVRVGPVDSAGLARIRRELATAGFHPLVIPTRHE